jgi:SOS-response transcriptional repressor LexA
MALRKNTKTRTSEGFARRLEAELNAWGMTQLSIANKLQISPGTVSGWFNRGYVPQPRILFSLAEILGVRPEWLLDGREPKLNERSQRVGEQVVQSTAANSYTPGIEGLRETRSLQEQKQKSNAVSYPKDLKMIPLLSWAQAGMARDFDEIPEHWQEMIPAVVHTSRAFAVQLRGDSMEKQFSEGDVAICLPPDIPARHGDLVVANIIDEGCVFKILNLIGGDPTKVRLKSYNPLYEPMDYPREAFNWICAVQSVNKQTRR